MAQIPVALQVYSVRKEAAADLPGTLAAIKAAGYDGVEFAGYYERSAAELKRLLDDNELRCAGMHTGLKTVQGDELAGTIDFNRVIGNTNLIVPGMPNERRGGEAVWRDNAKLFNELAEKAAGEGMRIGYHNHGHEFQAAPGEEVPWDVFGRETRRDVILQLDLGNAMH